MKKDIQRIALVRLSALGDIVNSAMVVAFIKQHYPLARVEWVAEEAFASVLENLSGVDAVHTINLKKLKKEKSFALLRGSVSKLRSLGEFDLIIDMQGLLKSAIVARILGASTHGFDKHSTRESLATFFYKTTTTIPYESGVVLRNSKVVADALGFEISKQDILQKKPIFSITKRDELSKEKKNIAFVIGASWDSKIYPKELVAKVCDTLSENALIIWGSAKEKEVAEWIVAHSHSASLAPKLALNELPSYISSMDLLIGNDTGPTHMAWAQNVPSITLFGPTNERMIFPTPINRFVNSPSTVDILKINKQDFSIKEIQTETIVAIAKELLQ